MTARDRCEDPIGVGKFPVLGAVPAGGAGRGSALAPDSILARRDELSFPCVRMIAGKSRLQRFGRWAVSLLCAFAVLRLDAVTLGELLTDPKMTPKKFAGYFEDFVYEFSPEVQPPGSFLQRRRGDCDDYAILADYVLKRAGLGTRLVHVRMVGRVAHAVCYVVQNRAYLDFNNRKYALNLQRSGSTLREIAIKVADSLEANWTSVSEFTYDYKQDRKSFGSTVVKTESPSQDADVVRK